MHWRLLRHTTENGPFVFSQLIPGSEIILTANEELLLNGLDATKTIRGLNHPNAKRIPIIAMTANAFDEDVQRSLQAGMNAHLSKPVEPERLFQTLEALIREGEIKQP